MIPDSGIQECKFIHHSHINQLYSPCQLTKHEKPYDSLIIVRKIMCQTQHSFIVETHMKLGIEDSFISLFKDICKGLRDHIRINGEGLNVFPPKIRDKGRKLTLTTAI